MQMRPAAVLRHEVDRLRRHLLGSQRQVALVLAILVVADDDDLAGAERVDGVLDAGERTAGLLASPGDLQWCSSYLRPHQLHSRGARTCRPCRTRGSRDRPAAAVRRFVCAQVNGTICTSNVVASSLRDGQADAVDGHRPPMNQIRRERARIADGHPRELCLRADRLHRACPVDVPEHHVAAEPAVRAHRALEIDGRSGFQRPEAA